MKVSFCSIGFQKNKWGKERVIEKPLGEVVEVVKGCGYDGIEIWYPHYGELDGAGRRAVQEQLAAAGLAVPMLSSYYDFTGTAALCAESLEHGRKVLADAVELGAKGLRMFTGKRGSTDATAAQWEQAVSALQQLADEAGAHGIKLAFETHSWNLMDTVASSQELMRRLGRKNVGLILQPSTFKDDYVAACEALAPISVHVHATNMQEKACALADGKMSYREILAVLKRKGFEGFVSVEWFGEDPEGMAKREAVYLRELLKQV